MLLEVGAEHCSGRSLTMRVLIDTGAEANLIRKGIMPEMMVPPQYPWRCTQPMGVAWMGDAGR